MIDKYSHGKVNADNLRIFLAKHACASELEHSDVTNWIRRYDKDVDGGLKFVDMVNALQTMTNFQPHSVKQANDLSRTQNEQLLEMALGQATGSQAASGSRIVV